MPEFSVVLMTAPDAACADRIARVLVDERLAACVNILPEARSVYRWEGKVEEARELLLVAKTRAGLFPALEARVRALHPHKVPEIIAIPLTDGSRPYLSWVDASVLQS
ncbi:MAG: divalent-cation tolerance protein CutA [Planctomycetes bacterium]|nr:divalent-cation tolerance protein CutA [Planctomycetota bacterium]